MQSLISDTSVALDALETDGVFETLRCYRGRLFALEDHLARWRRSARTIGLEIHWTDQALREWIAQGVQGSGHDECVVRVMWRRHAAGDDEPTMWVRPINPQLDTLRQTGVALRTSTTMRLAVDGTPPQVKSRDFLNGVLAWMDLGEQQPGELERLMLDGEGLLTEGTHSNLFAVIDDRLVTPPLTGVLPGVTRTRLMSLADQSGWPVAESPLSRHDLYTAREAFLSNSSMEVMPIREVDGRRIGSACPGPLTTRLTDAFRQHVEQEVARE